MSLVQALKANCKNCYKCLRICPVKSIRFADGQAEVMGDSCIHCGACLEACPQNAKVYRGELEKVRQMVKKGNVVASVAPSFLGAYAIDHPLRMSGALRLLGFAGVCETAQGASVISDALVEFARKSDQDVILSTCCPALTDLVEKHHPDLCHLLSPLVSPMIAHGMMIKKEMGEKTKVVFIGPCIAKIDEAHDIRHDQAVDAVLTFEELNEWLEDEHIDITDAPRAALDGDDAGLARMYPSDAGILQNVRARGLEGYDFLHVEGVGNCLELFRAIREGQLKRTLVEISLCAGSCLGGPALGGAKSDRFAAALRLRARAGKANVVPYPAPQGVNFGKVFMDRARRQDVPDEATLRAILRSIGKESAEDELNCSSCGYATCREKAIAVYQQKAEVSMCMPYMYQTAQSMSNVVLDNTPNAILVADENLRIREMNRSACQLFKLTRQEALDKQLDELMDVSDAQKVLETGRNIVDKRVEWPLYGCVMQSTLVYLPKQQGLMAIFRDITDEVERDRAGHQLKLDTMELAQKVIAKQMVAAQEIASLLGETTAETKATLTRLKKMIIGNQEEKP